LRIHVQSMCLWYFCRRGKYIADRKKRCEFIKRSEAAGKSQLISEQNCLLFSYFKAYFFPISKYSISLDNVSPWIMSPLNSVPFFEISLVHKKEHYSNFCTFEMSSLANITGHYLRKYGIFFPHFLSISMVIQQGNAVCVMGCPNNTSTGLEGLINFQVYEAEVLR
jgi:hypothetical protein